MKKEIFNAELRYYTVIRLAKLMLANGQITEKEFNCIRKQMLKKYSPYLTISA